MLAQPLRATSSLAGNRWTDHECLIATGVVGVAGERSLIPNAARFVRISINSNPQLTIGES
jgi:hypothetical protein